MKILEIIAPKGFQDHEYSTPKDIFLEEGHEVFTASKDVETAIGAFGMEQIIDLDISQVNVDKFDVIIFIGGAGSTIFQHDEIAHKIAKEAIEKNKIIGAICLAPTILAYAGLLKGKNATVWNGNGQIAQILTENGAKFTDEMVTVDGKIITANGPPAAEKFAEMIVEQLNS